MSTLGFKFLGRDCPICQGARRDCRESLSTGLIHCRDTGANPGGQWRYVKDDALGFGMWVWGEGESVDRPLRVTFAPPATPAPAVPVEVRDTGYRGMVAVAGLAQSHRAAILERPHVTESEVDTLAPYLFSWPGGDMAPVASRLVPGVHEGNYRYRHIYNWAIAIPNHLGQLLGVQIKNPDGGYIWASSAKVGGSAPKLENGELPMGVYGTTMGDGIVNLAEGYFKPAISAARYGGAWIGMSGGNWASVPEQFREALEALNCQRVILNADGGAIVNANVMGAYGRLAALLDSWDIPLVVRWWGQTTKSDGDVDEISSEVFHQAQVLPWAEFQALSTLSSASRSRSQDKPINIQAYRERKLAQKAQEKALWLAEVARLAGAPEGSDRAAIAAAFDQQHRLSGEPITGTFDPVTWPQAGHRKLVLLDGQKMTRKTSVALRSVVNQGRGRGASGIIYAPTRVLGRNLAKELGILTVDQYLSMDEENRPAHPWLVACPESAWKVKDEAFDIVCFDEGNEGLPRVQSGILGNYPHESRQAVKQQLINAPLVVLAQDKLYRPTVRAVQRWGHFDASQIETHQRRRVTTEMAIYLYLDDGNAEDLESWDGTTKEKSPQANQAFYTWFDGIVRAIAAGNRVAIPCGSETKGRAIHRALRNRFPEGRGQVLDGKYTPAGIRAQFADDPTGFAPGRMLDWLIFTPVFNSGVSIEGTYFDAQFEYVRAFESASSASQRGERNRDAIRGEKITERHVYIASRGMATMPDPAVFTADYWQTLLSKNPNTDAINLAQQMGCDRLIERINQETPEDWLELPEFMAIEARETYFKLELLTQEWQENGWRVNLAPIDPEATKTWSDTFYLVNQDIKEQKARTLAKAKAQHQTGDEPAGAIEATKHRKWEMYQLLGHYTGLNDAKWVESWVIDSGDTSLSALRIRALVRMAHEAPELWSELKRQFALSIVAKAGTIATPDLPCTYREFDTAKLLATCPDLYLVLAGQVDRWNNQSAIVREAAGWARNQAQELGRLSSHSNRIHGYQFTGKTPDIKAFHKLLAIVGLEAHSLGRQGTGSRLWDYRVKDADDIRTKLEQKRAKDDSRTHDLERQLTRHETEEEVFDALDQVLRGNIERLTPKWNQIEVELFEKHSSRTSVEIDLHTEVLDAPQEQTYFYPLRQQKCRIISTHLGTATCETADGCRFYASIIDLQAA